MKPKTNKRNPMGFVEFCHLIPIALSWKCIDYKTILEEQ
jgi:hypothetical protein